MKTSDNILETIRSGIRQVRTIEEDGYMFDDHMYMDTVAYWWYCPYRGGDARPTSQYEEPAYPEGPWYFAGITLNGTLVHEESRIIEDKMQIDGI